MDRKQYEKALLLPGKEYSPNFFEIWPVETSKKKVPSRTMKYIRLKRFAPGPRAKKKEKKEKDKEEEEKETLPL